MGIPKHLKSRLAQLEARVASLPDPEAERERERISELHYNTWFDGGSLEDIPEEIRDPSLWKSYRLYGHVILKMCWEESEDAREELLAAGVDFARAEDIDEDDVRAHFYRPSDPNTPHKP